MTTPIDTTRLRADADAVRDAGARVVQTRDPGGPAYLAAHHDLREATKRLYADAPPDAIILALLDKVDGLRARPQWERVLRLANGCTDYGGGHHGADHEVYQHGIWTVCNVLKAASEQGDEPDMQLRVVEAIGTDAMREPEEGGTP